MTTVRRQQIMSAMFNYLAELIQQNKELYNVLHSTIGMTHDELRECGLFYLAGCFQAETDKDRLMHKIESRYQAYQRKWSKMTPEQILEKIDEIHAVSVVYRIVTRHGISEDDAGWLVRFRNPLAVISDAWLYANDLDSFICEERLDALIEELRDRGDAEAEYVMDEDVDNESEE